MILAIVPSSDLSDGFFWGYNCSLIVAFSSGCYGLLFFHLSHFFNKIFCEAPFIK